MKRYDQLCATSHQTWLLKVNYFNKVRTCRVPDLQLHPLPIHLLHLVLEVELDRGDEIPSSEGAIFVSNKETSFSDSRVPDDHDLDTVRLFVAS